MCRGCVRNARFEWLPKIARAIEQGGRLPVVWLSFQGCTGCTESLLRSTHPTLEKLIFEIISLEYHETLNAGAGIQAEAALKETLNRDVGRFVLVAEGAIPVADKGVYVRINEQAGVDLLNEVAPKALAVIAIGSCASWGGIPSAGPNPTGAKSVGSILEGRPVVNIPGCPPNPYNFCRPFFILRRLGSCRSLTRTIGQNSPMAGLFTRTASAGHTLMPAGLPRLLGTMATGKGFACTSWDAKGRRRSPTARLSSLAMLKHPPLVSAILVLGVRNRA